MYIAKFVDRSFAKLAAILFLVLAVLAWVFP